MDISKYLGREITPSGQVILRHAGRVFIWKLRSHKRTGAFTQGQSIPPAQQRLGADICAGVAAPTGAPGGQPSAVRGSGARTVAFPQGQSIPPAQQRLGAGTCAGVAAPTGARGGNRLQCEERRHEKSWS